MKKFIKEYLNIIACAIIGFVFVLTSFYLVMNYYHSDEIKNYIYVGETDGKLAEYKTTIDKIKTNLNNYTKVRKTNNQYERIYQDLSTCTNVMTEQGLLYTMEVNRYYTPYDIYKLGGNFQSKALNTCWALHLSSLSDEKNPDDIKNIAPFVSNHVKLITKNTSNALEEIQNNSSYFFTTKVTSTTIRNYLQSDYSMVVDSYQEFADIVLNLSEMINKGGNNG